MLQVTDLAEKWNWDLMADQLITLEHELNLCTFVECSSHLTYI